MPRNRLPPNYEKEFIRQLQLNDGEVVRLLAGKDPGMVKKIHTFATRHNFSVTEVVKKIQKDPLLRGFFAKDPAKQKIHENIAARYVKKIKGITRFRQLGHAELALLRGAIIPYKEVRRRGGTSRAKTIDFSWDFCGKEFYASHKYTRGRSGGSQGSQYKDLQEFIREANESLNSQQFFVAICDGDYYRGRDAASDSTRIERLNDLANRKNVFALPIEKLEELLISICHRVKNKNSEGKKHDYKN